ncbi:DUF3052 domain-containing protein [Trueperella pecoris]|uniref:DUF3052 domain-containing protein n=1 Tax=Trueperella pecoris TaxID=2733571 RepID=A0A7M1R2G3_9ACTO|nr:DUF3052 family protein [Trueperella pecoris]QOR48480.1 DUF3052 domain-containing protein [Trueperella pecoris]
MSGSTGKDFGFGVGQIIQEFGFDDDVDMSLRTAIEEITGEQLEDEEYRGSADGTIAWWRSDDGDVDDLTDLFVDCASGLAEESAQIWLMVPEQRTQYSVPMEDVKEAADTAGLSVTSTRHLESGWTAFRVVSHGRTF